MNNFNNTQKNRSGFTLVELLVVIAIIGMLIALLLPAVQAAREAARRMQCGNNLKQLGLAIHNFHDTYNRLPCFGDDPIFVQKKLQRFGFLYTLLPFIEQTSIFNSVIACSPAGDSFQESNGISDKTGIQCSIEAFLCPSDGNSMLWTAGNAPRTNYRGSLADMVHQPNHGWFTASPRSWLRPGPVRAVNTPSVPTSNDRGGGEIGLEGITDGTSNAVLMSEGVTWDGTASGQTKVDYRANLVYEDAFWYNCVPNLCLSMKGVGRKSKDGKNSKNANIVSVSPNPDFQLGMRAYDNAYTYATGIFTLLPPNSPSCTGATGGNGYGGASASSEHTGGVQVLFGDGAVRFVGDTVHVQNLDKKGRYPTGYGDNNLPATLYDGSGVPGDVQMSYGVWSELGAINDGAAASL